MTADDALATRVVCAAARAGLRVVTQRRSAELTTADLEIPDLVALVDWLLPDEPGIELCRRLKLSDAHRSLPVILLVGSCSDADKRLAVEAGADLIVLKPVSVPELMHGIKTLVETHSDVARPPGTVTVAGIELDIAAQVARHCGKPVHLGAVDTRLLAFLMTTDGRTVTRREMIVAVWGPDTPSERTIDVYIARLRKALRAAWKADPIRTVRGVGYALGASRQHERPGMAARRLNKSGLRQTAR
jgi:two-component system phosphate regulon response regulator PhoB